ncbi:MAG: hypothetical protein ABID63_18410 [Pseudomonadota bacterium]
MTAPLQNTRFADLRSRWGARMCWPYDHTDKMSLRALAVQLDMRADWHDRALILAFCVGEGLLIPRGFFARFLIGACRLVSPEMRGAARLYHVLTRPKCRPVLINLWGQFEMWLLFGVDRDDPASAGGFNAVELGKIVTFCRTIGVVRIEGDM